MPQCVADYRAFVYKMQAENFITKNTITLLQNLVAMLYSQRNKSLKGIKMSFTQERETNLHNVSCDGCDKHCKLGFHHFTALGGKGTETLCCPTIDGQPIKRYKGKNGEIIDATQKYYVFSFYDIECAKKRINELAQKIVKYCDHYKQR